MQTHNMKGHKIILYRALTGAGELYPAFDVMHTEYPGEEPEPLHVILDDVARHYSAAKGRPVVVEQVTITVGRSLPAKRRWYYGDAETYRLVRHLGHDHSRWRKGPVYDAWAEAFGGHSALRRAALWWKPTRYMGNALNHQYVGWAWREVGAEWLDRYTAEGMERVAREARKRAVRGPSWSTTGSWCRPGEKNQLIITPDDARRIEAEWAELKAELGTGRRRMGR